MNKIFEKNQSVQQRVLAKADVKTSLARSKIQTKLRFKIYLRR